MPSQQQQRLSSSPEPSVVAPSGAPLMLDPELGIESAYALHERLVGCLEAPRLEIGGGQVRRLHAASLQLLCALFRERRAAGRETVWIDPSPELVEAARRFGAGEILQLVNVKGNA